MPGPTEPPTNPAGGWPLPGQPGRPAGPPPSAPPPWQAPTQLPGRPAWQPGPPQGPPPGRPPAPPGPPPGWAGGGPPGPPYGPRSRKRRKWPFFLALGLVLVLVAGLGTGGWLYFTGRLGFGPLSAADEAAADAVADGVGAPDWAGADDISCAVDELVQDWRAEGLEQRGLVERDDDDWTYTEEWETADATRYVEEVLDCTDDWADQVAADWNLDDPDCLEDIDSSALAAFFAAEQLPLSDAEEAEEGRGEAVAALDECYVTDAPEPVAEVEPAYRAVRFTFPDAADGSGDTRLRVDRGEGWQPLRRSTVEVDTGEGGRRGCLSAQVQQTYAWGTVETAEKEFCGTSEPRRIWWDRERSCTLSPGCDSWALEYEGFKAFDPITAVYTSNGGDCMSTSGSCSDTVLADADGRGTIVTWSFPASYDGTFAGKVGPLRAVIPD